MKNVNASLKKLTSRLLLISSLFFLATTQSKAQVFVDLQAVSIDPSPASLAVGATGQIIFTMQNNGPSAIPLGQATAQVTISSVYLDLGTPITFVDPCGYWSYLGNVPGAGTHNLFFQNNAGAIPAGGSCALQFNVKGKAGTPAPSGITLASSLSATATVSDNDGSNQAATSEITVLGTPDLTNSQFFTTTQIAAGGTIDEVVSVRNVGAGPTSAPIVFSVTNYAGITGLSAASNPAPSVTIGFTTYTLDNANWTVTSTASALTFTSNVGVVINPGSTRFLGVRITRAAGANGTVTHSSTIVSGTGGGETPVNNNSISNTLLKN